MMRVTINSSGDLFKNLEKRIEKIIEDKVKQIKSEKINELIRKGKYIPGKTKVRVILTKGNSEINKKLLGK